MKTIEYRVQFGDPAQPGCEDKIVRVQARDINTGLRKAVAEALRRWPYEINRVEFWQVV